MLKVARLYAGFITVAVLLAGLFLVWALPQPASAKQLETITGGSQGDGNDAATVRFSNVVWRAWNDAWTQLNKNENGGSVKECKSVPYNNEFGYLIGSGGKDGDHGSTSGGWMAKDIHKASPIECTSIVRNQKVKWRCNVSARVEVENKTNRPYSKTYVDLTGCNRVTESDYATNDASAAFSNALSVEMCKGLADGSKCKQKMNDIYNKCKQDKANDSDDKKTQCIKDEINKTEFKNNGNVDRALESAIMAAQTKCADLGQKPGSYGCSDPDNKSDDSSSDSDGNSDDGTTSCKLDGPVGWIICPLSVALGGLADGLYGFLANFLEVDTRMFSTSGGQSGSFTAYRTFLPIANIILAILFILIIYSEATGNGFGSLSNYTIKKMLPRLVIFAMLVNLSWWLCAAAVDFSNILGANLKDFFSAIDKTAADIGHIDNSTPGWQGIAAVVTGGVGLGAAAGAVVAFSQLIPLLIFVGLIILILVAIIILCILREAGLILLCVMAPIAFACAALPGTKNVFDKWLKFFMALLIIYPLISLIYGASALASDVIGNSVGGDAWLMNVVASAIKVLPLAAVPMVIMSTLDNMGVAGAKLNGMMQKGLKGARGKLGKSAKQNYMDSRGRRGLLRAQSGAANLNAKAHEALGLQPSHKTRQHQAAYATAINQQHDTNVRNAQMALMGTPKEEQKLIARTGRNSKGKTVDRYTREAAMKNTFSTMSAKEANDTIIELGNERAGKTAEELHKSGEDRIFLTAAEELNKGGKATMGKGAVVKIMNGGMVKNVQDPDMTVHAELDMEAVTKEQINYVASKSEKDLVEASAGEINGWGQTIAASMDAAVRQDSGVTYQSFVTPAAPTTGSSTGATPTDMLATTIPMVSNSQQAASAVIREKLRVPAQSYVARRQSSTGTPQTALAGPDTDRLLYELDRGTYQVPPTS